MSILSTSDIHRIHEASLRILSETGVQVDDDGVVELLREHGCSVVEGTRVVRMSAEVVDSALRQCPPEVKLASLGDEETVLRIAVRDDVGERDIGAASDTVFPREPYCHRIDNRVVLSDIEAVSLV